jgi:hypothetical protein
MELNLITATGHVTNKAPLINRLAQELLTEIFLLSRSQRSNSLSIQPSDFLEVSEVHKYTPWTLREVCVLWRNIVINTPLLWNRISVTLKMQNCGWLTTIHEDGGIFGVEHPMPIANRHLTSLECCHTIKRVQHLISPSTPLFRRINKFLLDEGSDPALSKRVAPCFLEQVGSRITHLQIDLASLGEFWTIFEESLTDFPLLEDLRVLNGMDSQLFVQSLFTFIYSHPHLCRLRFAGDSRFLRRCLTQEICWDRFVELTVNPTIRDEATCDLSLVLKALHRCVALKTLSFTTKFVHDLADLSSRVTLPILQNLFVDSRSIPLTEHLNLPNLQSFEVILSQDKPDIPAITILAANMISRSNCQLQYFWERTIEPLPGRAFRGTPTSQFRAHFEQLVEGLHSVTRYQFPGIVLGTRDIERIADFSFLPKATTLSFSCIPPYRKVLETLKPRISKEAKQSEGRIRSLTIRSWADIPDRKTSDEVNEFYMKEYGADVRIYFDARKL